MNPEPAPIAKISCIAVDDEPKALEVIRLHAAKAPFLDLQRTFRDPLEALSWLKAHPVGLVFLDINMPKISGLDFLNIIAPKPKIIFTTAYSEYALESYEYDTIDYLLKPIEFQRFLKAVTKVKQLISSEKTQPQISEDMKSSEKTIYIKSGSQLYKVNTNDILYLEKDGNYLTFHTKDKKILSRQNMKDVFDIVSPEEFIRVHKSFVVAVKHMEIIESHQIKIGSAKIPIGRNYREDLIKITGGH